jgi:hypothetical protein
MASKSRSARLLGFAAWADSGLFIRHLILIGNPRLLPRVLGRPACPPVPDIDGVTQEVVGRPGKTGDLRDKLRVDPMDSREHER